MTDRPALRKKIDDSGMTVAFICNKAGMIRETLYNRINGKGEFKASEIQNLTNVLGLSKDERDKIFFADGVN